MFEFFKEVNLVKNNLSKVNNVPSNEIFPTIFSDLYDFHYKKKDLRNLAKENHICFNFPL